MPLVLFLAACGGAAGGGGPVATAPDPRESESASAVSGSLYDGPIQGAAVYVDVNRNRRVDSEDHLIDDATDRDGNFEGKIPDRFKHLPLIADNRGAEHRIDEDVDLPDFFVAPAGSGVISPLTHIIELNIVREPVIRKHVLFGQFLPLSDNPHVIEDTSQGQGRYVFYGHIRNFLRDLTTILKQGETANWSSDRIEREVRNLLEKYQNLISDAAARDLLPTIEQIDDLTVDENTTRLGENTSLTVLVRQD